MYYSNIKVEQINERFEVVEDYGEILTREEMICIFERYFPALEHRNGCLYGNYGTDRFCIYFKNISYLGTPHPFFKKRIAPYVKLTPVHINMARFAYIKNWFISLFLLFCYQGSTK